MKHLPSALTSSFRVFRGNLLRKLRVFLFSQRFVTLFHRFLCVSLNFKHCLIDAKQYILTKKYGKNRVVAYIYFFQETFGFFKLFLILFK